MWHGRIGMSFWGLGPSLGIGSRNAHQTWERGWDRKWRHQTGNKRQTIKFSKNTLLFKPDLTIVRRWPCLRHSFLSRSHRDTIRKCRDRRRVCRRRLCIASFLRRPARSWCSRPIWSCVGCGLGFPSGLLRVWWLRQWRFVWGGQSSVVPVHVRWG